MTRVLERAESYEEVCRRFRWNIPRRYNIADDVCDRWAGDRKRIALVHEDERKGLRRYSFADVREHANRFANTLRRYGLRRGDRVSLLLGQRPECAIAHVACWKAGMVSAPCSVLYGTDAIAYRVNDSGARILVTDVANYSKVAEIRGACSGLERVLVIDGEPAGAVNFWRAIESASPLFTNVRTAADEVAWISYTSGTTGPPKGSMQPHRMLLGHMPSLELIYDFFPQDGDVLWSPADWAWMAGLMDVLMPAWFHGCKVVATSMRAFDAEEVFAILARHEVTLALLTPTMLKLMRQVPEPPSRPPIRLRAVASGGEPVGAGLHEWALKAFKLSVNENFGQTECNVILGNNARLFPCKPGSLGRPTPGSVVAIVDDRGEVLPPGTEGHIACRRPHPVMFLGYLNAPEATRRKFVGDWLITGDRGSMDEEGYFWFCGRGDDIISSAGYRIGPGEIEDALLKHRAVRMAAVIGVPDALRGEIIKAFVVPKSGVRAGDDLAEELRQSVRRLLARHEVPRLIEFVADLPMTATGKIMRSALRERERSRSA